MLLLYHIIYASNMFFYENNFWKKTTSKHIDRLSSIGPSTGTVRILTLTEKQYSSIWYLAGGPDDQEKTVGNNNHIML